MRYAVFLRGVNVGGSKPLKMEDLKGLCEKLGFENVKTFIQSGNVLLDAPAGSEKSIEIELEKELLRWVGEEVSVFARTLPAIQRLLQSRPFADAKNDGKPYVTFLPAGVRPPSLPLVSAKGDVEVFSCKEGIACSWALPVKGKYTFPNAFLEARLKTKATTRNPVTLEKMAQDS